MAVYHVYPAGEEKDHDLGEQECKCTCSPEIERMTRGDLIVIHRYLTPSKLN